MRRDRRGRRPPASARRPSVDFRDDHRAAGQRRRRRRRRCGDAAAALVGEAPGEPRAAADAWAPRTSPSCWRRVPGATSMIGNGDRRGGCEVHNPRLRLQRRGDPLWWRRCSPPWSSARRRAAPELASARDPAQHGARARGRGRPHDPRTAHLPLRLRPAARAAAPFRDDHPWHLGAARHPPGRLLDGRDRRFQPGPLLPARMGSWPSARRNGPPS